MNTFDTTRSAALRRQLGALPTTEPEHAHAHARTRPRRSQDTPDPTTPKTERPAVRTRSAPVAGQDASPRRGRRGPRWVVGGAAVAITAGLVASGPFQPQSTSGADSIPAMARPQQPEDVLPQNLREKPGHLDVSTSRLVGTERGYSYYAVESIDALICLVFVEPGNPVNPDGSTSASGYGCTLLKNFDSYPLQSISKEAGTKVWLVSANIEPTERQLTEQVRLSPNLYIEYTDDILLPGDEGYEYEPSWP